MGQWLLGLSGGCRKLLLGAQLQRPPSGNPRIEEGSRQLLPYLRGLSELEGAVETRASVL